MQNMEGSDVSYHEIDKRLVKEFKLYFNLLINSFNKNDQDLQADYVGKLTELIHKLEAHKKLPPALKEMIGKVKYIQHHIENMQEIEGIDPEIKKMQESLDKMG